MYFTLLEDFVKSDDMYGIKSLLEPISEIRAFPRWVLIYLAYFSLGGAGSFAEAAQSPSEKNLAQWVMINVNATDQQADAHLLKLPGGEHFLIDTSDGGKFLVPFLEAKGVKKVEKVFITHSHRDHYGGLLPLIESGIQVKEVYWNLIPRPVCDREKGWGCNYEMVQFAREELRKKGIPINAVHPGDLFYHRRGVKLEALYAFDGFTTPIGKTDVNDTSVIMLLTVGKTRALFTGDLNAGMGAHLAKVGQNLSAQILKVPHHGTESVAPNTFFDRVNPELVLVPSPEKLWLSSRSKRIRDYFESRPGRILVNGIDGHVWVNFTESGYSVDSGVWR